MKAPTDSPRVRDYARIVARGWLVILIATLLSAGAAVGIPRLVKTPEYQASVLLFATVAGDPGTWSAYFAGLGSNVRMATYSELAKSTVVTEATIAAVPLNTTPAELASRTTAGWVPGGVSRFGRPDSALLRVQVVADKPDVAVATVNALAVNLMTLSRQLEWTASVPSDAIQYTGPAAELVLVDPAKAGYEIHDPIVPDLAVGAGVGLALSVVIVLAMGLARGTFLDEGQLKHVVVQELSTHPRSMNAPSANALSENAPISSASTSLSPRNP